MMFSINALCLSYQHKIILPDLTLNIPAGKIIGLVGENGSGKSTLLKSLAKLLPPTQGEIFYQQDNIRQLSYKHYARLISFLPQQHFVPEGIRVRELVSYGRAPYLNWWGKLSRADEEKVSEAMMLTQTIDLAEEFASNLSGGQRQRVFIAMVLAQDTPTVLLDEPTTYLDLNHQIELMRLLRHLQTQGKTIITVLHDLNQACRYCDELIVLKAGRLLAQGQPSDIMTAELLQRAFDIEVEIHQDPISQTPMFIPN